jgi:hypothetical protein
VLQQRSHESCFQGFVVIEVDTGVGVDVSLVVMSSSQSKPESQRKSYS